MQAPGCLMSHAHNVCSPSDLFKATYPQTHHSAHTTDLCQELAGHCVQGLLGPGSEPVDGGVVDQAREVPAASLEDLPDGRHAEDDVQVAGTLLDEVGPHALPGRLPPRLHRLIPHLWTYVHVCT